MIGSVLVAALLAVLFVRSVPTTVEWPALPGISSGGSAVVDELQNRWVPSIGAVLFDILAGLVTAAYLYKATDRDVQPTGPADDAVELFNLLPLFGVAAISAVVITLSTTLVWRIHVANLQNHVYCELLQPGMTHQAVTDALSKLTPVKQAVFEDEEDSWLELMPHTVSYWRLIVWDDDRPSARYGLDDLFVGYGVDDQLVWMGHRWSNLGGTPGHGFETISCPWTIVDSLTAK